MLHPYVSIPSMDMVYVPTCWLILEGKCGVNVPYMDAMGWDVLWVFEMKKLVASENL